MGAQDGVGRRGVALVLAPALHARGYAVGEGGRLGFAGRRRRFFGGFDSVVVAPAPLGAFDAVEHALVPVHVAVDLHHAELEPPALPLDVAAVEPPALIQRGSLAGGIVRILRVPLRGDGRVAAAARGLAVGAARGRGAGAAAGLGVRGLGIVAGSGRDGTVGGRRAGAGRRGACANPRAVHDLAAPVLRPDVLPAARLREGAPSLHALLERGRPGRRFCAPDALRRRRGAHLTPAAPSGPNRQFPRRRKRPCRRLGAWKTSRGDHARAGPLRPGFRVRSAGLPRPSACSSRAVGHSERRKLPGLSLWRARRQISPRHADQTVSWLRPVRPRALRSPTGPSRWRYRQQNCP